MNTLFIGKNFIELAEVESTNTFCTQLLPSNPAEGTVVLARHQTAGRGQQGSEWVAQPALNLTFSLILYPKFLAPRQIFLLNKLVACALRDTLQLLLPLAEVKIKWPNDILVNRKKVAGTLIETSLDQHAISSAIIGIGLNVNQCEFEKAKHGQATSLALIAENEFDTKLVLEALLRNLEAAYLSIKAGRAARIEHSYLQSLYAYQEDTEVEIQGLRRQVHIVGVDADGRIAVQEEGKLYFYGLKEIRFIL